MPQSGSFRKNESCSVYKIHTGGSIHVALTGIARKHGLGSFEPAAVQGVGASTSCTIPRACSLEPAVATIVLPHCRRLHDSSTCARAPPPRLYANTCKCGTPAFARIVFIMHGDKPASNQLVHLRIEVILYSKYYDRHRHRYFFRENIHRRRVRLPGQSG